MIPEREYSDYLEDILDAIMKVEKFIKGMDFNQFDADDKTMFAVTPSLHKNMRKLLLLSENVN